MAGLDTRGFVDGAVRGFGLVDAYYDKEEDRARRDAMDAKEDERYERTAARQDEAFQLQKTNADRNYGLNVKQFDLSEKNADRNYGLNAAQFENTKANQAWQRGRAANQDAIAAQERQRKRDLEEIQAGWNDILNGVEPTEKTLKLFDKYPSYNPTRYLDPTVSNSIDTLTAAGSQAQSDDDLLSIINSPNVIESFNNVYQDQINKGDGKNKRASMVVPVVGDNGEKAVGIDLSVEGEDGKTYNAPITTNRTSKTDDTVKAIPLKDVINQVSEMSQLNQIVKNLPQEQKARLLQIAQSKGLAPKQPVSDYQLVTSPEYEFGQKTGESPSGRFDKKTGEYTPFSRQESTAAPSNEDTAVILDQADRYASDQVSKQAGLLTSDGRDFAQFGGDRNKAYQFYRNQYLKDAGVIQPQSASLVETLEARFGKR